MGTAAPCFRRWSSSRPALCGIDLTPSVNCEVPRARFTSSAHPTSSNTMLASLAHLPKVSSAGVNAAVILRRFNPASLSSVPASSRVLVAPTCGATTPALQAIWLPGAGALAVAPGAASCHSCRRTLRHTPANARAPPVMRMGHGRCVSHKRNSSRPCTTNPHKTRCLRRCGGADWPG